MGSDDGTRIQLCGRLVAQLAGRRSRATSPAVKGGSSSCFWPPVAPGWARSGLIAALWPEGAPDAAEASLAGCSRSSDAPLIEERRRWLDDVRLGALECVGTAGLRMGGTELAAAERAGRSLVEAAPIRESGYRLLMEALDARGNVAEALRTYDELRVLLREELGVAPGQSAQELHRRLLGQVDAVGPTS